MTDPNPKRNSYVHAIACYAVSEGYGLTQIPMLKVAMDNSIRIIIEGQNPDGGYDYGYKKGARQDTSVTGWNAQALKVT